MIHMNSALSRVLFRLWKPQVTVETEWGLRRRLRPVTDRILFAVMPTKAKSEVMRHNFRSIETASRLLNSGFDVNGVYKEWDSANWSRPVNFQWTPLSGAVLVGVVPMIEFLLARGANPNLAFRLNQHDTGPVTTALCCAAMWRNADAVEMLLKHHADPDPSVVEDLKSRPLCLAAANGDTKIVKLLMDSGAIPTHSPTVSTAVQIAKEKAAADILRLLVGMGAAQPAEVPKESAAHTRARQLSDEAVPLAQKGRHEEARARWRLATETDPSWSVPWFNLARSFLEGRQPLEAKECLAEAKRCASRRLHSEDEQVFPQLDAMTARLALQESLPSGHPTRTTIAGDASLLQGTWRQTNGAKAWVYIFRGDILTQTGAGGAEDTEDRFRLNEQAQPRTLELLNLDTGKETAYKALYEVTESTLRILVSLGTGQFPSSFEDRGRGRFLFEFAKDS